MVIFIRNENQVVILSFCFIDVNSYFSLSESAGNN